jgi:hypothetical protein
VHVDHAGVDVKKALLECQVKFRDVDLGQSDPTLLLQVFGNSLGHR